MGESNAKPERACKNCRHYCAYVYQFDENVDSNLISTDYGQCRRFPPTDEEGNFPVVEQSMWCGEFDI